MALTSGTHLGPYEIQALLGSGGMGEVYRARDTRLDRIVAVKILRPDVANDMDSRDRFESEARAISRLNHPNICVVHDIGRERAASDSDERLFLVMEFVEGESLVDLLARGPLTAAQVVRGGRDVAAALEEAHQHGVVHGDLKPGNIIVTKFGLKLLDFGLARRFAIRSGSGDSYAPTEMVSAVVGGTLPYMAPETLRGEPPDTRSDVWALGVVLHEMATGRQPFMGATAFEVGAAILNQPLAAAPVWVPLGLQAIIGRCLAKDPGDRYQHAREVQSQLEAIQSDPSIVPPAPAAMHNLPTMLTPFIGRDREVDTVKPLVSVERLVTLTGAGGAGKTRLALRIAQDLVGEFPHGVWLIELSTLTDSDLIPQLIAATLGMRAESAQIDALLSFLRPRKTLLVLDNCEHMIGACAELAMQVLRACPGVHLLATSREALAISGEHTWRVPSLWLPDAKSTVPVEAVAQSDAVRFFVDRAQAVAPEFHLSPEMTPTVASICRRLDSIPLALELAAARTKVLSLEQLAARLSDRFQLLTGGSRTAVPRQQTLRATIDWSYDLLSDRERRLLRRLSVFAGGCSLEAAEYVCAVDATDDTIELLSQLIDKSLVHVDDATSEGKRYRLLETVRQYARDRLFESGEAVEVRDRHFQCFYQLALEAEPELIDANVVAWLNRLAADHDNLRAALEWALSTAAKDAALRMVCALWSFWNQRNHFAEGREWVKRALAANPDAPRSLRARALLAVGDFSYLSGDHAGARTFCGQVLALDDPELGPDRWAVVFATMILAVEATERNQLATAAELAEHSVSIGRTAGAPHILAMALIAPMFLARLAGDYEHARALVDEALALLRPRKWMIPTVLYNLCDIALKQGDAAQAEQAAREGVVSSREMADNRALSWCLAGLACTAAARKQVDRAARLMGAAEGISESAGAPLPMFIRLVAEEYFTDVRESLGDARFSATWNTGRLMMPEAVVVFALRQDQKAEEI